MGIWGRTSYPIARKEHQCECCSNRIVKGQQYFYEVVVWDNQFYQKKLCLTCHEMCEDFSYIGDFDLNSLVSYYDTTKNDPDAEVNFYRDYLTPALSKTYCSGCYKPDSCNMTPIRCPLIRKKYTKKAIKHMKFKSEWKKTLEDLKLA